jgi:hypothetical protein
MKYVSDNHLKFDTEEEARAEDKLYAAVKKAITSATNEIKTVLDSVENRYPHVKITGLDYDRRQPDMPEIFWQDKREENDE